MKSLADVLTTERKLLGFDLETTGTNVQTDRIVELGLEIMTPGQPVKEYRKLLNPGIPIPPGATKIHGITDEMVKDAPTFEQLADNLLLGFTNADFCGYNVRFDLRLVQAEFTRSRRVFSYEGARIIDSLRLWQIVEGRSLEDAVKYWLKQRRGMTAEQLEAELGEGKAHGALWDVKAATRSGVAILELCDQLPRDIQQLHDLCWPGWVDAEGKLQWKSGHLCFSFGQHRGVPLQSVPRDYLNWVARRGNFSERVKEICNEALHGNFPTAPNVDLDEDDED